MDWLIPTVMGLLLLWGFVHLLTRYTFWLPWRSSSYPRLLMYHQVNKGKASGMNCPPERFESHLRWLARSGYRFVTVSELPSHQGKVVALTFDDGYRDNFDWMFPILSRYGAKATIYLAPDIDGIERLTDEQIQIMSRSELVEFGAHTMTHINLQKVDREVADREIRESKKAVERIVGRPCQTFAYPYGRYHPEHVSMVAASGYTTAVTTRKKIEPWPRQCFELPRVSIHGGMNWLQFRIALGTGKYRI